MSYDVLTLLDENLQRVFGEGDDNARLATVERIYAKDAVFVEPHGVFRGWQAISDIAGKIRAMHPSFRYTPIGEPDVLHGEAGRVRWVSGEPGQAPAYAGTDVITVKDGLITALYLFFDGPPDPSHLRAGA
ncbi:nuclear transport factor 2 family protein [Solimonas marina]|uniref:Nuclear transport factor 2 family protein n=1 Tax=Solimonas marina TaxID=2714601 RepID=A0A969WFJ0_9GAMM|nr:nuclear transport factor 2 family protein [Solimonas marina]NKF23805.1 nuclear transport factor 2 family protein [Solimonas marina]